MTQFGLIFAMDGLLHHSPATTTRSNRGFELSPRLRSSKIVIRSSEILFLQNLLGIR